MITTEDTIDFSDGIKRTIERAEKQLGLLATQVEAIPAPAREPMEVIFRDLAARLGAARELAESIAPLVKDKGSPLDGQCCETCGDPKFVNPACDTCAALTREQRAARRAGWAL